MAALTQARKVAANVEPGTQIRYRVGVVDGVHVSQSVDLRARQAQRMEPLPLEERRTVGAHGNSGEHAGHRLAGPDEPVTAIVGRTKNGVDTGREQRRRGAFEIRHAHLGSVHADEQHRAVRVFPRIHDCSIKTLAEATLPLGNDDEPARDPAAGETLERHHPGEAVGADN